MQKPNTRPAHGFKPAFNGRRKFVWDGQPPRPIKKGEFYLSGAIPAAYEALSDSDSLHFILKEVPRC